MRDIQNETDTRKIPLQKVGVKGVRYPVTVLDKTRKIGKLLHTSNSGKVVFNDICRVLCDILSSNMFVISKNTYKYNNKNNNK